ncbi:uncharacterized protein LOC118747479 [Rhagoletis pomonella]|uniref:uncharacterized protein LOC118747479 n=1 Tax=Rhagoletis pomonella TaxID=28610 RepID=UPI00177C7228|nr:uncharacterized protein LOC118747479 [Rhagoletis pomonella]
MAILLVHLRRLILLLSIVYLSGAVMRRLLSESRHIHLQQHINGKTFAARHLHFQAWAYIYTAYAYVVLVNYVSVRRLTNMLEFFLT